jgi:hypothetical protein
MTYEKAVQALVTAGMLDQIEVETAVAALNKPNVEFTYPDWARALAKAGLIAKSDVDSAAVVMEEAGQKEAEDDPKAFDEGLENAGIL